MRNMIIAILLWFGFMNIFAQYYSERDTTQDGICAIRGHIESGLTGYTLMGWSEQIIDLEDKTIIISHNPNRKTYYCSRCGEAINEPVQEKPDTTIIWRRQ
jgi:hypothetical protein